jgi:hypothetical protein
VVWIFQRAEQRLKLEVRNVGPNDDWEMVLQHPDGRNITERFARRDLLQSYLVTVEDTLTSANWHQVSSDDGAKAQSLRLVSAGHPAVREYVEHGVIAGEIRELPGDSTEVFDLSEVQEDIPREWNAIAQYTLDGPARCPHCREPLNTVRVLRLKRAQVSFTSSLPRAGSVIVCPLCERIISAELGGRL